MIQTSIKQLQEYECQGHAGKDKIAQHAKSNKTRRNVSTEENHTGLKEG